jgi:dihydrofolate reductase
LQFEGPGARQTSLLQGWKAIAAMSLNRVIGAGNKIPWHLPEDFKWFKQMTTGQIVVMGRRTFESIGKALPNRRTLVLTRTEGGLPGAERIASWQDLEVIAEANPGQSIFICGGAVVYEQALPRCSDLYLTVVKREVEGDTYFPKFEHLFHLEAELKDGPEFKILHYRRKPETQNNL